MIASSGSGSRANQAKAKCVQARQQQSLKE
jgi:hypothetical protein